MGKGTVFVIVLILGLIIIAYNELILPKSSPLSFESENKVKNTNTLAYVSPDIDSSIKSTIKATIKSTPTIKPTIKPTPPLDIKDVMFDDFNYTSLGDINLINFKWKYRDGPSGYGVSGNKWSPQNISFVKDPVNLANRLLRLTAFINETEISQADLYHQIKYFEGSYAARVRFPAKSSTGSNSDQIVQTFYLIAPVNLSPGKKYSECDFEYLPNGGFGGYSPGTFTFNTWDAYGGGEKTSCDFRILQINMGDSWHTLLCVVKNGQVKYYVDGNLATSSGGAYYPDSLMKISFNIWFDGKDNNITSMRSYTEDVDWVFFKKDQELSTDKIHEIVKELRSKSVERFDDIPD